MDPHTAVAYKVMKDYEKEDSEHKCVLLSTASPYKFAPAVYEAIFGKGDEDEFACMKQLEEKTGAQIPAPLKELSTMEIRHNALVDKDDMEAFVQKTVEEMFHD
jgi:threonine synthase